MGGGRNGKEKSHESRNGKTPGRNRNELAQSIVSGLLDQISRKKGGQKKKSKLSRTIGQVTNSQVRGNRSIRTPRNNASSRESSRALDWNHYLLERGCHGDLRRSWSWGLRLPANGMGSSKPEVRIRSEGAARAGKSDR
jgi:hypothetical protein